MLLEEFVPHDPALLSADDMAALVAPIFAAARQRRIDRVLRTFAVAKDRGLAAGDLAEIGRAAVAGRVATLLVEADRLQAGHFDRTTGAVATDGEPWRDPSQTGDVAAVMAEDMSSALAETVLLHGGGILSLERDAMPTATGVAAIYPVLAPRKPQTSRPRGRRCQTRPPSSRDDECGQPVEAARDRRSRPAAWSPCQPQISRHVLA